MTRRSISLALDTIMLVVFVSLLSWRLTGVPIHEWAATALLVVLVVHLVIHWHWVETRISRLRSGPGEVAASGSPADTITGIGGTRISAR